MGGITFTLIFIRLVLSKQYAKRECHWVCITLGGLPTALPSSARTNFVVPSTRTLKHCVFGCNRPYRTVPVRTTRNISYIHALDAMRFSPQTSFEGFLHFKPVGVLVCSYRALESNHENASIYHELLLLLYFVCARPSFPFTKHTIEYLMLKFGVRSCFFFTQ